MNRDFFLPPALEVAPKLLGSLLTVASPEGSVVARITEVEAYHGVGAPGPYDPGSHARDKKTPRNAAMFGEPGHTYVYLNYGMHYAINLVCSPAGTASGVLIRSAEIVEGADIAAERRLQKLARYGHASDKVLRPRDLARGPGNLATALGVERDSHDGLDLFNHPFEVQIAPSKSFEILTGPRVGVAGVAGGPAFPWRFWVAKDPTVSAFKPGRGAHK